MTANSDPAAPSFSCLGCGPGTRNRGRQDELAAPSMAYGGSFFVAADSFTEEATEFQEIAHATWPATLDCWKA